MEKIWAPWRNKYIIDKRVRRCIFCIPKKNDELADRKILVVARTDYSFSILNKYPYNNGHIMVVPYRHVRFFDMLSDAEVLDIMDLVKKTKSLLEKVLSPDGFNIGMNVGRVAGAGIEDHRHIHIVPRWNGDTNFMPVLAGTKVISQSLIELHKKLVK